MDDDRRVIAELELIDRTLSMRDAESSPCTYDLPDLLRARKPEELECDFESWRNRTLVDFVSDRLYILKDGKRRDVKLIGEMERFLTDMFYMRQGNHCKAIVWKPRGAGGSVVSAMLLFLTMVYRKFSFVNLAGSQGQARIVYDYVLGFFNCFPEMRRAFLDRDPTTEMLQMKTGTWLICSTASDKQARGKHCPGLIVDEAVQQDANTDRILRSALQIPSPEPESMIVLVSTFHQAAGLYQEVMDFAEEMGYERYRWDIFDAMVQCREFFSCKHLPEEGEPCPLTQKIPETDPKGTVTSHRYEGCCGKARTSRGFQSFGQVLESYYRNFGSDAWATEFCCIRPEASKSIYNGASVDRSVNSCPKDENGYPAFDLLPDMDMAIGLDWGFTAPTALTMGVKTDEYVAVVEAQQVIGKSVLAIARILEDWIGRYKGTEGALWKTSVPIWADGASPQSNEELRDMGFDVTGVPFQSYKVPGIENLGKYFEFRRIRVLPEYEEMIRQLKAYRWDKNGRPHKGKDHFCDSLLCLFLRFEHSRTFGHLDGLGTDRGQRPAFSVTEF